MKNKKKTATTVMTAIATAKKNPQTDALNKADREKQAQTRKAARTEAALH